MNISENCQNPLHPLQSIKSPYVSPTEGHFPRRYPLQPTHGQNPYGRGFPLRVASLLRVRLCAPDAPS